MTNLTLRLCSFALVALAAACTASAPEETNVANNKLGPQAGAPATSTGGAAGSSTGGSGGDAAGGGTAGSGTGGTSSGGSSGTPSTVGNKCMSDAECTGYPKGSCLTELKPLKGKITDPMNPSASKFENDLVMPYPGGYCTNTIENSCLNDAGCGVGAGCFRGLDGVDKNQLQMLDDMKTCDVSMTGMKNPGGQADGTTCKKDTDCLNGWCKTFLPFSTVQFADTGLCLHPCKTADDCRKSEGYICDIPMSSLITIINPSYTNKYCVGPFSFMLLKGYRHAFHRQSRFSVHDDRDRRLHHGLGRSPSPRFDDGRGRNGGGRRRRCWRQRSFSWERRRDDGR